MLDWASKLRAKINRPDSAEQRVPRAPQVRGGLVAGTVVATERGWVPVEKVCAGDRVMTFDDGLQEVIGLTRRLHPMGSPGQDRAAGVRPLMSLPAGLIGNWRTMLVPEGQEVLVESDYAKAHLGDPFATLEATELLGLQGARKLLPEDQVVVVTLAFAEDQMIFVEGQALAHCPAEFISPPEAMDFPIREKEPRRYPNVPHGDAEMIVASMSASPDATLGTHAAPTGVPLI